MNVPIRPAFILFTRAVFQSTAPFVACLAFLAAAPVAAMPVPRQVVIDLGPYADADAANGDAAAVSWHTGDPRADIVTLAWAAIEVRTAFARAGVPVTIVAPDAADTSLPSLRLTVLAAPDTALGDHGYRISQFSNRLRVQGNTRVGVLYGTYRVLEKLGFRWFAPGDDEIAPGLATQTIDWGAWREVSTTRFRGFWIPGASPVVSDAYLIWMGRNRLNLAGASPAAARSKLGVHAWSGGHRVLSTAMGAPGVFEAHPDWFGLVSGTRRAISSGASNYYNPAFVNPDMADYVAEHVITRLTTGDLQDVDMLALWPSDGARPWDESAAARAVGNDVDTLFLFYDRVISRIEDARDSGRLTRPIVLQSNAYNTTWQLPSNPGLYSALANRPFVWTFFDSERSFAGTLTTELDVHPANRRLLDNLSAWKALPGGVMFGMGEYFNNSNYGAIPITQHTAFAANFRTQMSGGGQLYTYMHPMREAGVRTLTHWLLAHVAWAGAATTDSRAKAWRGDFFARSFGAQADAVRAVYGKLEAAVSNAREIYLRRSMHWLLFNAHHQLPGVWTPAEIADLADLYVAGGTHMLPAPLAATNDDVELTKFLGVRASLTLLEDARRAIATILTQPLTGNERRRVEELQRWADAAWQRYELMRTAALYYRGKNVTPSAHPASMQVWYDRIAALNAALTTNPLTADTVSPQIDQRDVFFPPERLHVPPPD